MADQEERTMQITASELAESRRRVDERGWKPRNCVFELTLACNLRCEHCGSIAGKVRKDEMSVDECLGVVDSLADLGCELITLSGGEPTLKKGWDTIARRVADRGVYVNMVTNGVYKSEATTREVAQRALDAGMCNVGVSIDGPEGIHELVRGEGTFRKTLNALEQFQAVGLRTAVLTTVSQLNLRYLPEVRQVAMDAGATLWRLQLAKPMGSMDKHRNIVLRPEQLLELVPLLARLKKAGGIHLGVGDSIGYYGPYDKVLRGRGWRGRNECWKGCQAGMQAIGIEADGGVKGCLSMQAKWDGKDPFVEGNVRERSLADIWYAPGAFPYNRDFKVDSLTGGCAGCRFGELCRGGARCVSAAVAARLTEDPYCYYRVAEDARVARPKSPWAAAAGAALFLSLGTAGCPDDGTPIDKDAVASDVVASNDAIDAVAQPEYGVTPPDTITPEEDVAASPEYGVAPDDVSVTPDYGVFPNDVSSLPEYGVPPEDISVTPDYGVFPDDVSVTPEYGIPPEDVSVTPDYGVFPDDVSVTPDYGVFPDDVSVTPDYGVFPEDISVMPEYGIAPDVGQPGPDAIDCAQVCCECEYGIIPDDVYKECCAPDPCANACCDCDYGEPPPPECCD